MRLAGGESEFEGRVEVCLNRRWGTVSSDGWMQTNTRVVCNELGYDFSGKQIRIKTSLILVFMLRYSSHYLISSDKIYNVTHFLRIMHGYIGKIY